jgi:hypothetical protein
MLKKARGLMRIAPYTPEVNDSSSNVVVCLS